MVTASKPMLNHKPEREFDKYGLNANENSDVDARFFYWPHLCPFAVERFAVSLCPYGALV